MLRQCLLTAGGSLALLIPSLAAPISKAATAGIERVLEVSGRVHDAAVEDMKRIKLPRGEVTMLIRNEPIDRSGRLLVDHVDISVPINADPLVLQ